MRDTWREIGHLSSVMSDPSSMMLVKRFRGTLDARPPSAIAPASSPVSRIMLGP
jgi:hypothetical protein